MGVKKMMSPKSKYKGPNMRASKTVKSQAREEEKVHWTPVFALGKVSIYVCDAEAARCDVQLPARLNDGQELAKFIRNVLPGILEEMQQEHGWNRTPRTVVHDKASYFVAPRSQHLASTFAKALMSHIRRGLDHRFPRSTPGETRARFANRMRKVENYMNSSEFTARDGGGLASLAESLRERFQRLALLQGERLRT